MSNNLAIDISANDKFSVTFTALDKQANNVATTLDKNGRSQKEWGDQVGKSIAGVSRGMQDLASSAGLSSGPLNALFSVGASGGILAGALAAAVGVVAITKAWAEAGLEIDRTSTILGVSSRGLQEYREATKLAGGTVEGMTASISQLGMTLQDSLYGRNPQATMLMNAFGISIVKDAQGAIDILKTRENVFKAMNQIQNPMHKRKFAQVMGLPEEDIYTARKVGSFLGQARGVDGLIQGPAALDMAVRADRGFTGLGQYARGKANRLGNFSADAVLTPGTGPAAETEQMFMSPEGDNSSFSSGAADALPVPQQRKPRSATPAALPSGEVTVNVTVPEGARVTATSNGPPVKVQRTGPVN